jgi:hypothetical protein
MRFSIVCNLGKAGFETKHHPLMRILGIKSYEMKLTYIRRHESLESPRPGPLVPVDRRPLHQEFHQLAEFDPKEDMHMKTLLRRKGPVQTKIADDREHE